jgi:hypothetical protein
MDYKFMIFVVAKIPGTSYILCDYYLCDYTHQAKPTKW